METSLLLCGHFLGFEVSEQVMRLKDSGGSLSISVSINQVPWSSRSGRDWDPGPGAQTFLGCKDC